MKTETTCTIEQAIDAMSELAQGDYEPSLLSALRNAALSTRMALINNAGYAIVLRKYRDAPLPDRATLLDELKQAVRQDGSNKPAWSIMSMHIDALYSIDRLFFDNDGLNLRAYDVYNYGDTYESQSAWRDRLASVINGMAMKTLSWALFIYDPYGCLLMTVDTIHCQRVGVQQCSISGTRHTDAYRELEQRIRKECLDLYPDVLPTITAAMLWLNFRQQGITSHIGISCRY